MRSAELVAREIAALSPGTFTIAQQEQFVSNVQVVIEADRVHLLERLAQKLAGIVLGEA